MGRFTIHIPKDVHEILKTYCYNYGITINKFVKDALKKKVDNYNPKPCQKHKAVEIRGFHGFDELMNITTIEQTTRNKFVIQTVIEALEQKTRTK